MRREENGARDMTVEGEVLPPGLMRRENEGRRDACDVVSPIHVL